MASHDLREPLRTIRGFSELLSRHIKASSIPRRTSTSPSSNTAVARMSALITDLLAYSRVPNCNRTQGNAPSQAALQETLWDLRAAIDDSGAAVTHGDLPTVPFDGPQLSQVFLNLIANAIKYRRKDESPRVHVSAETGPNQWIFSVRDNGLGFAQEHAERIFTTSNACMGASTRALVLASRSANA